MPKNKMLRIRLTENQFIRIKNNMEAYVKKTLSAYSREVLLNDIPFMIKLNELVQTIKRLENKLSHEKKEGKNANN